MVQDRHREQARQKFFENVDTAATSFVRLPREELDGRSLVEIWQAGGHEVVAKWLDAAYAATEEAIERRLREDPDFLDRLRQEAHAAG